MDQPMEENAAEFVDKLIATAYRHRGDEKEKAGVICLIGRDGRRISCLGISGGSIVAKHGDPVTCLYVSPDEIDQPILLAAGVHEPNSEGTGYYFLHIHWKRNTPMVQIWVQIFGENMGQISGNGDIEVEANGIKFTSASNAPDGQHHIDADTLCDYLMQRVQVGKLMETASIRF